MRVDPSLLPTPASASAAQRRPAAAGRFVPSGDGPAARSSGIAGSATLATLDALIAVQGEGADPGERRRRSLKRGHDLLGALDRLKAALLVGSIPVEDLRALVARLAERRDISGDPELDDLLAHVELRAAVELAKFGAG